MKKAVLLLLLGAALAPASLPAATETQTRRARFFLTAGFGLPGGGADYSFSYDPHPGYDIPGSTAGQTLRVEPALGPSLEAGFFLPLGRAFGLRLSYAWDRSPLGGENGPYAMLFKYTNWWPLLDPVRTSLTKTTAWAPTFGSRQDVSIGLEVSLRWPIARGVDLSFLAGPRLFFASGSTGALGYTEYMGSSHGAQFFREYLLRLDLPPQTRIGWTAGVEAEVRLSTALSLLLRAGFASAGAYEAVPEIAAADEYYGLIPADEQTLAAIRRAVALPALTLPLGRFELACGLALGL
ncbi:MAG: hypothetical protein NTZ26_12380 [Candidatus Aminicenantes bacterium]|nr:hypothetical protein [Candidatus Aminicenantes bacterium]